MVQRGGTRRASRAQFVDMRQAEKVRRQQVDDEDCRRQVRRALYIAAVSGRRNNAFGAFYDKLVNAGKPP